MQHYDIFVAAAELFMGAMLSYLKRELADERDEWHHALCPGANLLRRMRDVGR
jgi:hypothetical protein